MMDQERFEELAAMNALGMLENDEKRSLDGAVARDKELRMLAMELEQTTAELAYLIEPVEPPANMKKRIRAKMRATGVKGVGVSRGVVIGGIGWALAASFAVTSIWLWREQAGLTQQLAAASRAIAPVNSVIPVVDDGKTRTLEEELKKRRDEFEAQKLALATEIESLHKSETEVKTQNAKLTAEVAALKQQEKESKLQVATLQSKVWEYRRSEMLVVWDEKRSQGVVMLDKMPKVESDKDYQLWVVDPNKPNPVSAGVVTVDDKGFVKASFKPVDAVTGEAKFALSVEKKGGVPKSEGQLLMVGP
ncbi:anti-sigma factor [Prosthecobacter sp.]|uniref:anti-sigma factor n=1 Tax=Prosthecobacter sp. TaxID=1965333 RepID=UPI0024895342|nr:anti-sigma factor [Prosthecobacter sp.]MDI1313403.1 anti-sigma factor [Prosthecobacter sp.]